MCVCVRTHTNQMNEMKRNEMGTKCSTRAKQKNKFFLFRSLAEFCAHLIPLHFIHLVMMPHSHCDTFTSESRFVRYNKDQLLQLIFATEFNLH